MNDVLRFKDGVEMGAYDAKQAHVLFGIVSSTISAVVVQQQVEVSPGGQADWFQIRRIVIVAIHAVLIAKMPEALGMFQQKNWGTQDGRARQSQDMESAFCGGAYVNPLKTDDVAGGVVVDDLAWNIELRQKVSQFLIMRCSQCIFHRGWAEILRRANER